MVVDRWRNLLRPGGERGNLASEHGFTLIELLVAAAIGSIVLAAVIRPIFLAGHQQTSQASRASTIDSDRIALDRMTRDIRQANAATLGSGGQSLVLTGTGLSVTYSCGTSTLGAGLLDCSRTDAAAATTAILITGITAGTVFTLSGNYVSVDLQKKPSGSSNPVILDGGGSFRVRS